MVEKVLSECTCSFLLCKPLWLQSEVRLYRSAWENGFWLSCLGYGLSCYFQVSLNTTWCPLCTWDSSCSWNSRVRHLHCGWVTQTHGLIRTLHLFKLKAWKQNFANQRVSRWPPPSFKYSLWQTWKNLVFAARCLKSHARIIIRILNYLVSFVLNKIQFTTIYD